MVVQQDSLATIPDINLNLMALAMHADSVASKTFGIWDCPVRPICSCIFLACFSFTSQVVYADAGDTFTPYVGYGVFSGDNVTRETEDGNPESDTWRRTTVGVRFDKSISRQRVTADFSMNDTKYDRFSRFDNPGRKGRVNWDWVLGNRLSGNVGTSFVESVPIVFDSNANAEPIIGVRTQKTSFINGGWHLHPSWRVTAGINRDDVDYEDQPNLKFQHDTAEFGLNYVPKSGNKIGVLLRHGTNKTPIQQIGSTDNYTQDEVKANINWQITGKTNLQFLGGWATRNAESEEREYSGPDARLTVNWAATGKTRLNLALWRELGSANVRSASGDVDPLVNVDPNEQVNSNYSRNTGARVGADWQATSKIKVDGFVLSESRDYNGIDRSDRYVRRAIGLTYLPLRQWSIRISAYKQQRKSSLGPASSASNNSLQLSTRYEF